MYVNPDLYDAPHRLCLRCGSRRVLKKEPPTTSFLWPTGVDYLDVIEIDTYKLWVCPPCWEQTGMELYLPSFGFYEDELSVLACRYDANFIEDHGCLN